MKEMMEVREIGFLFFLLITKRYGSNFKYLIFF